MAGDYLEKIVQIPLTIPALGQGDTEAEHRCRALARKPKLLTP